MSNPCIQVLFGMFVIAIACDQFEAIFSDETLVGYQINSTFKFVGILFLSQVEQAKKQGPFRPRKPRLALLAEVSW